MMQIIRTPDTLPSGGYPHSKSIFLAGPTPRDDNTQSWRPAAIKLFHKINFEGVLIVPEPASQKNWPDEYMDQVEWEQRGLIISDVIMFWVPRLIDRMPGFTTNVEFGHWLGLDPDKVVYGRPEGSEKCRYLDWLYNNMTKARHHTSLANLVCHAAAQAINSGSRPGIEEFKENMRKAMLA